MAVENWVDARGYIRNKPLTARVQCPRCRGTGELNVQSYPREWPIKSFVQNVVGTVGFTVKFSSKNCKEAATNGA